jgi:single-stranded DNA-binding protein
MAQSNHVSVKGDITGDIYYDILDIGEKQTTYLRLYMMINGSREAHPVKGLRICMYGLLAELTYGHVHKGSRIFVEGHVQTRTRRNGDVTVEVVAEDVDFIRNIDYERGNRVIEDLKRRGLFNTVNKGGTNELTSISMGYGGVVEGVYDTPTGQNVMVRESEDRNAPAVE